MADVDDDLRDHPAGPVRLCCMERHYGALCPDGKVMCSMCFDRFEMSELAVDDQGAIWDVCKPCFVMDELRAAMERIPYSPPRPVADIDIKDELL